MGIIGMKVFAADGLVGQAKPEELLYYTLSLPVSLVSVGMPTLEYIQQTTTLARDFQPLKADHMRELSSRLSGANKTALDLYFHHHRDEFFNPTVDA
jgi:hypothetical protein